MPASVRPAPAYIAASVASQIVTDNHNAQLRDEDDDASELENAVFSEQSLSLLNAFLDHLLFAFLSSARSPSLTAIRPAISDVLKPRLAREAMEAADEELEGLLAGEDDEELPANAGEQDKWDVEKVWKRTRLRIMVYTRLGELEDEDEDKYVQQERGLSMDPDDDDEAGLVSWASAIFLTSVVEHIAEQTLLAAGSAAFARVAAKVRKLSQSHEEVPEGIFERLVIEEPDVEKIALNSALGRLWRTWRKRVRSPISPMSPGRGIRPVSSFSSFHVRKPSQDTIEDALRRERSIPEYIPTETEIAANIPLPQGNNDVNEIEVPGLANTFEEDVETQMPAMQRQRSNSFVMLHAGETSPRRTTKARPLSMPMRPAPLFTLPVRAPVEEQETIAGAEEDAMTEKEGILDEGEEAELQSEAQKQLGPESPEEDPSMVEFAASTGMGFSSLAPVQTAQTDKTADESVPSSGGYESEPKVYSSKRMSIEKTGPPGLVRTFSMKKNDLAEGRSYLDDAASDDEPEKEGAIGIARTSDIPIRSTPTPPVDAFSDRGKAPAPALGGYVEVQPRQSARSPITQDGKPIVPERSVARSDGQRKSSAEVQPQNEQVVVPRKHDSAPAKNRGGSLPSLQEIDTSMRKSAPQDAPYRGPPLYSSPQRSRGQSNREASVTGSEKPETNGSPSSQTRHHDRTPSDKTSLKRGHSSASSTKKAGSFSVVHSSGESMTSHRSRGLSGRMSEEDREREFDFLVKGQDTVKYTLTPQNMRDLDESAIQRKVEPPPAPAHAPTPAATKPATSSVTVYPRVDANKDSSFGTGSLPNRSVPRSQGPVPTQQVSRKAINRPLAREPRVDHESMRDFADFIRSTGPSPGQEKPVQPFVSISNQVTRSPSNSTSSLVRKLSTSQKQSPRNVDSPSMKPRINMEPRTAEGNTTGNNDLIDFIRQGPNGGNGGQPRIPRNVAPFRTTVDSDQFEGMLGQHGNIESAYGSTTSTVDSEQTANSRSGLLGQPKVVHPAYSNTPQKLSGSMAANNEPVITKTRRRNKDPYAIDLTDDEDEDLLTALPSSSHGRAPEPKQESLMDFLNATDPPSSGPSSKPEPFMLSAETIAAARARANSSNTSVGSANTAIRNGNYNSSTQIASDAPRAYKPRLQARTASGPPRTQTSDLADFLRNSGPPEPVQQPSLTKDLSAVRKDEEKKSRKFWRSKKTYGDMP